MSHIVKIIQHFPKSNILYYHILKQHFESIKHYQRFPKKEETNDISLLKYMQKKCFDLMENFSNNISF